MHGESTTLNSNQQQRIYKIPAGMMQNDNATELFGCLVTKKVFGISEGQTVSFDTICPTKRAQLFEMLTNDPVAMEDLRHLSEIEAVEQFAFCNYGGLDSDADFCIDGDLKAPDNFLCSNNCRCIFWDSKKITFDGAPLTTRKIEIIRLMASDMPDKQIADHLRISQSTLDTHKTQLFEIFHVGSKTGLIMKAVQQKIIQ